MRNLAIRPTVFSESDFAPSLMTDIPKTQRLPAIEDLVAPSSKLTTTLTPLDNPTILTATSTEAELSSQPTLNIPESIPFATTIDTTPQMIPPFSSFAESKKGLNNQ